MPKRKITIEIDFDFQDVVYLRTDRDQDPRLVTAVDIKPSGAILYQLSCGSGTSWHYGFEIADEKQDIIYLK